MNMRNGKAITVAIALQKGGTGKSSTASALGAYLTTQEKSVLYVDLDPQGSLTYTLGADSMEPTIIGALTRTSRAGDALQGIDNYDVLASSPDLSGADELITGIGKEYRLKEALETLGDYYDFIIIDTPPALGILTINALTAADYLLMPAQADAYSLRGITQLMRTVETVRRYANPDLTVLGIVLTRYHARTILAQEIADLIEASAEGQGLRLLNARIREATAVKEAQAYRRSIFEHAPKSNVAEDYRALAGEVLTLIHDDMTERKLIAEEEKDA